MTTNETTTDPARCKEMVHNGDRSCGFHQCHNKHKRDGYCGVHHPDAQAKRDKAAKERQKKHEKEMALKFLPEKIGRAFIAYVNDGASLEDVRKLVDDYNKLNQRTKRKENEWHR